jgi:tetratricopeptide (TPR) repeat protein
VLEAEVQELVRQGAARVLEDGRVEPLAAALALQYWPPERRAAAHRTIAELLPLGEDGRFFHVFAARLGPEMAREACALADRLAREGDLGEAGAVLEEALHVVRQEGGGGELELLEAHARVAFGVESPRALDRTLYELGRAGARGDRLAALEKLVRAAGLVGQGDGERALAELGALPALADPEMELLRQATRVAAAGRCAVGRHEEVLAEIEAWAATRPEAEPHLAGWLGLLRYRQGRFDEAAELHARAAAGKRALGSRLSAMLNAGSALLEAGRYDEAGAHAEAARRLAAECRHGVFEARAEWIRRSAAYRSGAAHAPDQELLASATHLDVAYLEGFICLNEAAVAWRAEQAAQARALAWRAAGCCRAGGVSAGAVVAEALAIACGEPRDGAQRAALADEAARCGVPGIAVQALGLLGCHEDAQLVAEAIPQADRDRRREILSIHEALSMAANAVNPRTGGIG